MLSKMKPNIQMIALDICEVMFVKKLNITKALWIAWACALIFPLLFLFTSYSGKENINANAFLLWFIIILITPFLLGILNESKNEKEALNTRSEDSIKKSPLCQSDIEEISSMPLSYVEREIKICEFGVCDPFSRELLEKNLRYQELKKRQVYLTHPEIVDPHVFPSPDPTLDNDNERII